MRLFIGIPIDPAASTALLLTREKLVPFAGEFPRWSAPESWHVTLQFLGEASSEQATCIAAHLGDLSAAPVPIRLSGLDFFARAGVFFAGVELSPELLGLQQLVTAATRHCGFQPEDRPYHPHITLARARGRVGPRALQPLQKALGKSTVRLNAAFVAREFLLYESFPTSGGSRYQVRTRFPLEPSGHP